VIHSATKFLDGQGRVLGGAVCGPRRLTEEVFKYLRTAGPTLSAFNAWVLLKGLETLKLRVEAQSAKCAATGYLARSAPEGGAGFLSRPAVAPAIRTGESAAEERRRHRSFEMKGAREQAWTVVDHCQLLSITANLGDTKTTITHPASTTHGRITPEARAAAGISEGLLRIAVGLEAVEDLQADLERGLSLI
jgi:O-succinylhomoserine sulfhydrylase